MTTETTNPDKKRCKGLTKDGAPCSALAFKSDYCQWHNPELADARREWRVQGGLAASNVKRAQKHFKTLDVSTADLDGALAYVMQETLTGKVPPAVANAIATLARTMVTIRQAADVEERLAALENQLQRQGA